MTIENRTTLYSIGKKQGIKKHWTINTEHAVSEELQPRRISSR